MFVKVTVLLLGHVIPKKLMQSTYLLLCTHTCHMLKFWSQGFFHGSKFPLNTLDSFTTIDSLYKFFE
ncbi:hypothetical protein LDENG_00166450 [Lucifuga dentata]|nr:hypothetical protein LDENG_00166450 [Lucifuga dentata]